MPKALAKAKIDMSRWTFCANPRAEFHEMFLDAWRLERDYFYDRNMHGVDWQGYAIVIFRWSIAFPTATNSTT